MSEIQFNFLNHILLTLILSLLLVIMKMANEQLKVLNIVLERLRHALKHMNVLTQGVKIYKNALKESIH